MTNATQPPKPRRGNLSPVTLDIGQGDLALHVTASIKRGLGGNSQLVLEGTAPPNVLDTYMDVFVRMLAEKLGAHALELSAHGNNQRSIKLKIPMSDAEKAKALEAFAAVAREVDETVRTQDANKLDAANELLMERHSIRKFPAEKRVSAFSATDETSMGLLSDSTDIGTALAASMTRRDLEWPKK